MARVCSDFLHVRGLSVSCRFQPSSVSQVTSKSHRKMGQSSTIDKCSSKICGGFADSISFQERLGTNMLLAFQHTTLRIVHMTASSQQVLRTLPIDVHMGKKIE